MFAALTVPVAVLAKAPRSPLIWQARGTDSSVFVFGVGSSPDRRWLSPPLRSWIEMSQVFWCESPVGPVNITREFVQRLGTLERGTLFDQLPSREAHRVAAVAKRLGFPRDQLETMKPWYAARVLWDVFLSKHGASIEAVEPPDSVIVKITQTSGKKVYSEFSTWKDFMQFFDQMPQAAQVQYLSYQLDIIDRGTAANEVADDAWENGDSDFYLHDVLDMKRRYPELYRCLLIERNAGWARRIGNFVSVRGDYFVVVGINHTLGPDSIQRQASKKGITMRALRTA